MKKLLGCLVVVAASIALVVACGSSSSTSGAGDDGGSSGTSGSSGSSDSSGASGSSGTSGSSGDAASDAPTSGDRACDPAKTDCNPGEVCSEIARPAPVCRAPCTTDAECTGTPKRACVLLSATSGACIPTCAPFGTDCPTGFTCTAHAPEAAGVTQTSNAAFCRKIGGTALMASCVNDPASCGANAECLYFPEPPQSEGVNDSRCHTLCDAAHPCAAAKGSCFTKTGDAFGFCNAG